jgi:hypothetical protein
MNSSSSTALQGCVTSLRTSMQLLESSINTLDSGVHDYPRLTKVLQTTRVSPEYPLPTPHTNNNPLTQPHCTALRTSLRARPPNRPTNPPLLPRTRTQRPLVPRRNPPRQNVAARARSYRQSGFARRAVVESDSAAHRRQQQQQTGLEIATTEHGWSFFIGGWFEQFGAVEDEPAEAEEGEVELCC